jgi:hypothetical protein
VEEAVCLKDKALFVFASVMFSRATIWEALITLNETFVVEVTGTFTT